MTYGTPRDFKPVYRDPTLPHQIVVLNDYYSCNCLHKKQQYHPIGRVGSAKEMAVGFDDPRNHIKPFGPADMMFPPDDNKEEDAQ